MSYETINDLLASLTMKGSFWAMFLSKFKKVENKLDDFIVGVGLDDNYDIFLEYNFKNLNSFNDIDINTFLQHECEHLLNNHFIRGNELKNKYNLFKLFNIAADMAINCTNKTMKNKYILNNKSFVPYFPKQFNFPDKLLTEEYFRLLKKEKNKQNQITNNEKNNSDNENIPSQQKHENWIVKSDDPNLEYIYENNIRNVLEKSFYEYQKSFGCITGDLKEKIEKYLEPPKLPYYMLIKKYIMGSRIGKEKLSYSRINRKRIFIFSDKNITQYYIPPFPSKKKDKSFNIGVLLDTSASIPLNNNGIYEALSGIENILKNDKNSKIILIQNDTKILEEKQIKSIKEINRIVIKGRGGTNLLPGLHRFKELNTDVTIVFTDGYFKSLKNYIYSLPKKILWVLPEKNSTETNLSNTGIIIKFPI